MQAAKPKERRNGPENRKMAPEVHEMAGHLIRRLNQISASIFQDRMKAKGYDLTSVQFAAMTAVNQKPGIDQATLAGMIAYDRATIGGVVDRLENKGFLERKVSKHDRRARELSLTKEGEVALAAITPVVESLQDDILTGLDASERKDFIRLATKAVMAGNELSRAPIVLPE